MAKRENKKKMKKAGAKIYGHKSHISGNKRSKKFVDRVLDSIISKENEKV